MYCFQGKKNSAYFNKYIFQKMFQIKIKKNSENM